MIVRCRLRYRDDPREASCYRWLHLAGTPPASVRASIPALVFQDWAGLWRPDTGSDTVFYGLDTTWFNDDLTPFGLTQQHRPTPVAGGIALTPTYKPELCAGIVYASQTMLRRIYRAHLPFIYVSTTGELNGAGRVSLNNAENLLLLGWDWVNVSRTSGTWELIAFAFVQPELMTHSHRKVHVPLTSTAILPG